MTRTHFMSICFRRVPLDVLVRVSSCQLARLCLGERDYINFWKATLLHTRFAQISRFAFTVEFFHEVQVCIRWHLF
jgi:hypothetical protein